MFAKIVWASDGSEHADRALGYAVGLAEADQAELHAVHVVERIGGGRIAGQYTYLNEQEREAKVKAQLAEVEATHPGRTALHRISSTSGHVATQIVEVADRVGADLIVVGTRGHSALGGLVLGSVTQRLLHEASCPVLVVPPPVGAATEGEPHSETAAATG